MSLVIFREGTEDKKYNEEREFMLRIQQFAIEATNVLNIIDTI